MNGLLVVVGALFLFLISLLIKDTKLDFYDPHHGRFSAVLSAASLVMIVMGLGLFIQWLVIGQ